MHDYILNYTEGMLLHEKSNLDVESFYENTTTTNLTMGSMLNGKYKLRIASRSNCWKYVDNNLIVIIIIINMFVKYSGGVKPLNY